MAPRWSHFRHPYDSLLFVATAVEVENPYGLQLWTVISPTGSPFHLQTEQEAEWYERQRDQYLTHNRFTNVSDLEDLARLLTLEIMVYRWTTWLTQGFDYLAGRVNETELKNAIKEYSVEIRLVKASLGIDRVTREKDKGETVGDYIANLLERAAEFAVHRNEQYALSVTFIWELVSMIETYDRCDEQERRELDLSPQSIMEWVRTRVMPKWADLNESFRAVQTVWINEL
jgi:hypothetical protein